VGIIFMEQPEPDQPVTIYGLRHPSFNGIIWLGTVRPKSDAPLKLNGVELIWSQDQVVTADLTLTPWTGENDTRPRGIPLHVRQPGEELREGAPLWEPPGQKWADLLAGDPIVISKGRPSRRGWGRWF
jgi:hypothetical protein